MIFNLRGEHISATTTHRFTEHTAVTPDGTYVVLVDLAELVSNYPPIKIKPPALVSQKTLGALNLLSPRQRDRFWASFKKQPNERRSLNLAKSSPQ